MPVPIDILENNLLHEHPQLLEKLLFDHTTQKNIFWATDSYADYGEGYAWGDAITIAAITGKHGDIIMPRVMKSRAEQQRRSKQMAEVFTPAWLVEKMTEVMDCEWEAHETPCDVPENRWQRYVLTTHLELTCGEAPFLTTRYDAVTGEAIAVEKRAGVLDHKLQQVNQQATDADWSRWALLALATTYGYEWQGDNLLLAREALLGSFTEYHEQRFGVKAPEALLLQAAEIIAWNLWQMDGLKGVVPGTCHDVEVHTEGDLFAATTTLSTTPCPGCATGDITQHNGLRCQLRRWFPSNTTLPDYESFTYRDIITKQHITHNNTNWPMKFDFVIGNPPYQEETVGEQKTFMAPIYNKFMDATYAISQQVELVTPARFLFNAGGTPKEWNKKMLEDIHLKVLKYYANSSDVFYNQEIKGGIVITLRNQNYEYEPIQIFTPYETLNLILHKVNNKIKKNLESIISNRGLYRFSSKAYQDFPDIQEVTSDSRIGSYAFNRLPMIFSDKQSNNSDIYCKIVGNENGKRVERWIKKDYILMLKQTDNFKKYKVAIPKASGNGTFGEAIGEPIILEPNECFTETYISVGEANSLNEALAIEKYIKSKFARAMLGVLKITQDCPAPKWKYVPLQDFTSSSDIDWTKSIHEIDLQLYDKYGLTAEERHFIETHVKEMDE